MRSLRAVFAVVLMAATIGLSLAPSAGAQRVHRLPRWVLHVKNYPGGLSGTVRMYARKSVANATRAASHSAFSPRAAAATPTNVQMNTFDSDPPLPQNETSVAFKTTDPDEAVAASNDYVDGGLWIGHTTDGGATWSTYFQAPQVGLTRDKCTGGDPSVVYSARDETFYASQLCFMRIHPESEAHVYRSTDGVHWTPSRFASIAVSNVSLDKKGNVTVDGSVFYDKELLAVDNDSSSDHYGRLYMTYVKFHMKKNGFSDYCPVQLAYTDDIDENNNGNLSDTTWSHTSVVADPKGNAQGLGETANQWATPVVDENGGLDIAYAIEECNTSVDHGLRFTRSTDGGATFSAPVTVDKPGQFADNPDPGDLLAPKTPRLPISPSLTYDAFNNSLVFAYQNNVGGSADISSQYSTDSGATWSNAALISYEGTSPTTPAANDQFFPALAADGEGTIHAIWFDNRNDAGNQTIETFHAVSTDGGATWSTNEAISDVAWDPNISFFASGSFIGDYNWIAASPSVVYPVWTDGRNTPGPPNGQTDIFTALGL